MSTSSVVIGPLFPYPWYHPTCASLTLCGPWNVNVTPSEEKWTTGRHASMRIEASKKNELTIMRTHILQLLDGSQFEFYWSFLYLTTNIHARSICTRIPTCYHWVRLVHEITGYNSCRRQYWDSCPPVSQELIWPVIGRQNLECTPWQGSQRYWVHLFYSEWMCPHVWILDFYDLRKWWCFNWQTAGEIKSLPNCS